MNDAKKLTWLRAAVLGANDGIVSTAALVVGVAGASNTTSFILTAGVAGALAGALSMAVSEYTSVSTQRDAELALNINQESLASPWHAAVASCLSFSSGAILPLLMVGFAPEGSRIPLTFLGVLIALVITGILSARTEGVNKRKAIVRIVVGGILAMAVTFAIGRAVGIAV
jgi:VIT1/CCC1 family predicted Fe2+/Mn2+ transporter